MGATLTSRLRALLPRGNTLSQASWDRRHRVILTLLWLHVPALYAIGVKTDHGWLHPAGEVAVIVVFAIGAGIRDLSRDVRASLATVGLVVSSGILVHFTGGLIEMHFHFFVVVAVVALYQSWYPFLLAIAFVLLHHGAIGALDSMSVFNHPAALRAPWKWAALHALFIAAESAAALAAWKLNELSLDAERTARVELEDAVADLSEAQSLTHIGSWDWDVTSEELVWSDETYRICGASRDATPTFEGFMALIPDDERREVRDIIEHAIATDGDVEYECHLVRADGSVRLVRGLGRVTVGPDGVRHLAGTIQDMTERRQALHDSLTGLPNRTLFVDRVTHARTQQPRDARALGVLFVDLDNFKTVNDTKGHLVGDAVLQEVGKRIAAILRPGDTVARMGGDEFAILLNGVEEPRDVMAVSDRILQAVGAGELLDGVGLPTASIGIVIEPAPGARTAAELLRDADIAMYSAKRNGKAGFEIFDATMREELQAIQALRSDLRRATERDELFLQYQPIVRTSDGGVEAVEALVRWRHPERGVVMPLGFISAAEESGRIGEIGRWILERACTDSARWGRRSDDQGPVLTCVNVSPVQLLDPAFVGMLAESLSVGGLEPTALVLEITEGVLVHDAEAIERRLHEVKEIGVQVAIDDFGAGYSSLGYIHRFPIDLLKIDRLFIEAMTEGDRASALVRAVVQLGETLGLGVVAEGVETHEQARLLREMGCPLAQGFLFSRPADADDVEAMVRVRMSPDAAPRASFTPARG